MKTAKVELSWHMNIDLQPGIYGTEIGNKVWKKPLFCLKFSPKNFILLKIAFMKTPFFQKSLLGGL